MFIRTVGELTIVIKIERAQDRIETKDLLIKIVAKDTIIEKQKIIRIEVATKIKKHSLASIRSKIAKETNETRQLIDQMKAQRKVSADLHQDAQRIPTNDGEAQEARFRKL